jgi:Tol biopolymer transport system component
VTPPLGEGEIGHIFPHWLPDGKRFLYLALSVNAERPSQLYLGSLDGGEPRPLRGVHSRAEYASGELFYWEDGSIVARPLDVDRATFTGDPDPVCHTPGGHYTRTGMTVFAVAQHGGAVACGSRDQSVELRWIDRSGRDQGLLEGLGEFGSARISPAGNRVVTDRKDRRTGTADIWTFDLERGVSTRLVGGPGDDDSPTWSPDGKRIAYTSDADGPPRIFIRRADGVGGSTEVRIDEGLPSYVTDWSLDGTSVLYRAFGEDTDVYLAFVEGNKPSRLFAGGPGAQMDARFSPDGAWVALASTTLGPMEIFVAPLADGTALQRVSPAGGTAPAWSRDGREIYYAKDDTLYAVSFSSQTGTIGVPRELFSLGPRLRIQSVDVVPDGDRFLVAVQDLDRSGSSITLVLNRPVPVER